MSADLNEAECDRCGESLDHSELELTDSGRLCPFCVRLASALEEDEAWARDRREFDS